MNSTEKQMVITAKKQFASTTRKIKVTAIRDTVKKIVSDVERAGGSVTAISVDTNTSEAKVRYILPRVLMVLNNA